MRREGGLMVIGAAIALRKPFSKGGRTAVAWLGFTVMTFSTVLILAGKETGAVEILAVASVLAGIGGALGGGGKAARSGQNTVFSAGSGLRPVGGEHVALPGGGAGQGLRAADEIRLSRIG